MEKNYKRCYLMTKKEYIKKSMISQVKGKNVFIWVSTLSRCRM